MRHFRSILIPLLGLAIAACSQPPPPAEPAIPPAAAVPLDPTRGAVLPVDRAERIANQCSRISPSPVSGAWLPEEAMIRDLEARLGEELQAQLATIPDAGATAENYYRQYAGLLIGGRHVIYVNGLHANVVERDIPRDGAPALWTIEPVMLCDGGTLTFGVEYDPVTKAFANFAFNGRL